MALQFIECISQLMDKIREQPLPEVPHSLESLRLAQLPPGCLNDRCRVNTTIPYYLITFRVSVMEKCEYVWKTLEHVIWSFEVEFLRFQRLCLVQVLESGRSQRTVSGNVGLLRMQDSEILLSIVPEAALESAQKVMPSNAIKGSILGLGSSA